MSRKEQANADSLGVVIGLADGDVREGVRRWTGDSLAALARRIGKDRRTVSQCLGGRPGRTYPATRRALEAELGLPAHHLDAVIR